MSSLYFPSLYPTYNLSFELIFFFFSASKLFQSSNSSCEAYQAAAASRHAAEIVLLTVTGDVLRKLFSWEINSVHSDHNLLSGAANYYTQTFSSEQRKAIWPVEWRIMTYCSRWYYMFKMLVSDWSLSWHITQSFTQLFNPCFNSANSHAYFWGYLCHRPPRIPSRHPTYHSHQP